VRCNDHDGRSSGALQQYVVVPLPHTLSEYRNGRQVSVNASVASLLSMHAVSTKRSDESPRIELTRACLSNVHSNLKSNAEAVDHPGNSYLIDLLIFCFR